MKKYLSFFCSAAAAVAMIVACDNNGKNNGGTQVDPEDPSSVKAENLVAYFPLESESNAVALGQGISYSAKAGFSLIGLTSRAFDLSSGYAYKTLSLKL